MRRTWFPNRPGATRAGRRWIAGTAALALTFAVAVLAPPQSTLAAWTDTEYGRGSLQARTVSPPRNLQCSAGVLTPPTFTWTLPASGLTRSGFTWSLSGGFTDGGTLGPATSVTVPGALLGIGSGTFRLVANGPGGWTSTPVTGTLGMLTAVLYTCSVP
ncbi:hypothetical protein [Micromonospora craniellae]|uniref:Uncharacterized protein n=1 Tax=Micromonospora craniellae TaxID=2294034 RepID=A0A372G3T6_9ACTN|nr:hypothetical protein [Micromonospora craniellae]QOC92152.1 hypothetical protein ID554_30650 [Micromonospora craniellae]RFS47390.1 hypothetical protein D0Q02_05130 [Micromonospora craniellae]